MDQQPATGLKSAKLPTGTKVTIVDIQPGERDFNGRKVASDTAIGVVNGKRIKIAVSELAKMRTKDDKEIFQSEAGAPNVIIPDAFTISSSTDRTDRDGRTVYPLQAYNLADAFVKSNGKMTWDELVAGDLRDDKKFEPVQNYVVAI